MATTRPTLLVVDDEPAVLHSIHDLLRLDYRVITREDGPSALEVLENSREINVVMSDQRMPGMSGVELLRRATTIRPETTRLLFTAYADLKAVVDAINQGCVYRYVTKPWDPEELQTVIRQAVEKNEMIVEKMRLLRELKETNQRLLEANRLKGAFIEVASHELNTPVAVVLGMTQLWRLTQAEKASCAERNWIERIHNAGTRLASVVERMLKLVRSDDLAQPLDFRMTPLEGLIHGAVAEMSPFLSARCQRVAFEIHPELGEAEIDAGKISDVLTNLLINAIKFTADEGTIIVSAVPEGPDHVRLSVIDQGVGIDPATRPFIFEPFFAGFDTMHHSSGDFQYCKRGIGLGLSLVKRFVDLHGGRVECKSTPGAGSTFSVTLPRRASGRSASA
jgi:signal transduction histidine kinase